MTEKTQQTQTQQAENEFLKMLKLELQIMSMQADMIKLKAKMAQDELEK